MNGYILIEKKGDIEFYEDSKGTLYYRIGKNDISKVKDGKIAYMIMGKVNGFIIKYEKNGVHGFSIWKGNVCLEDNLWVYDEVLNIVYNM